jgi:ATP-dependent Zn protease
MVNELLPITEIEGLLQNLPNDDQLDQAETDGIARMDALLQGRFNPVSGSVEPSA